MWGPTKGFQSHEPLWNSYKSTIEKGCVSNLFHSFQVIPMRLATLNLFEDVHHIHFWGLTYEFQSYAPFWNSNISIIEKVCVSNFFHSFQVLPMKLATSNLHEESMFITSFLWGLTQRLQSYVPFFKTLICAYWEGVSIFFHSFQVKNMIFWLCLAYFLWQSGKRGYIYHNEW